MFSFRPRRRSRQSSDDRSPHGCTSGTSGGRYAPSSDSSFMAEVIQLGRTVSCRADCSDEFARLAEQFRLKHWISLPRILEPGILQRVLAEIDAADFDE